MTEYFTGRPLQTSPYVEIFKKREYGDPVPIGIMPELAGTPSQMKFSASQTHAAFVYDIRREETPGIGNPTEGVPGGIRVFSPDDMFLILGGTDEDNSKLYVRAGPGYRQSPNSVMPVIPNYVLFGLVSAVGEAMALVTSDEPNVVKLYSKTATDFTLQTTIGSPGGAITKLEWSPVANEFIVHGTDAFKFVKLDGTEVITSSGSLLTFKPNGQFYIVDTGDSADLLQVYTRSSNTLNLDSEVPMTLGDNRRAKFSPDGAVLATMVATAGSNNCPLFLTYRNGAFMTVTGNFRANSTGREFEDAIFSTDSEFMLHSFRDGGAGQVELYKRGAAFITELEFLDNPATLPTGFGRTTDISPDGAYVAVGHDTTPFLSVYKQEDGTLTKIANPDVLPASSVYKARWSPDGSYLAVTVNGSPRIIVYKRVGDTLTKLADPAAIPTTFCYDIAWSPDSGHLAFALGASSPYVRIYKLESDTLTAIAGPTGWSSQSRSVAYSPNGELLAIGTQSNSIALFTRSGDTYTAVALNPPNASGAINALRFTPDSNYFIAGHSTSPFVTVYKRSGTGTYFPKLTSPIDVMPSGQVTSISFTSDGTKMIIDGFGTSQIGFFDVAGDVFTHHDDPANLPASSVSDLSYSSDGSYIALSLQASPYFHVYGESDPIELPTYLPETNFPGTALHKPWAFSPDGAIAHFGSDGLNYHKATASPYGDVDPLPFEPNYDPSDVSNVQYSATGLVVVYDTPDGPSLAVRSSADNYIKLSDLNGVFIGLYIFDAQSNTFVENGWVSHAVGATVKNLVFSDTPRFFSYFALNGDPDPNSTQGRHIYHCQDNFEIIAIEYDANMEKSFLAFDPEEVFFAATYYMSDGNHVIDLYKFDPTGSEYSQVDSKAVLYGPVDFSTCMDVIVAHGGETNPFTLFKVENDLLVQQDYPVIDWDSSGIILDVAIMPDCDEIVVVTPEEVVTVDKDDDQEELTVEDSAPTDTELTEDTDVEVVDDDTVVVNDPGSNGGGGWTVGDEGGLTNITYIPYVAVHVHYRVNP